MALYLPIRAISRSQQIRIGSQRITRDRTHYVDLSVAKNRRDLERHSALGGIITVGPLSYTDSSWVVREGGEVTAQGTPDQTVDVAAGELFNRATGAYRTFAAVDNQAHSAAHGSNPRIDIVQVNVTNGTVSKKDGTAAVSPVAPAPDASNEVLATVTRAATDNTIATADIADVRKRP